FGEIHPSSPSMALLKGEEDVHFIHRHVVEGATMDEIIKNLEQAFEKNC
ncbi:BrxA/BrxB family bacilliredoxin, partial [Bacillus anthracis]